MTCSEIQYFSLMQIQSTVEKKSHHQRKQQHKKMEKKKKKEDFSRCFFFLSYCQQNHYTIIHAKSANSIQKDRSTNRAKTKQEKRAHTTAHGKNSKEQNSLREIYIGIILLCYLFGFCSPHKAKTLL